MRTNVNKTQHEIDPAYVSSNDPRSKRKILQAALHLFVLKGVEGVTVRDLLVRLLAKPPARGQET